MAEHTGMAMVESTDGTVKVVLDCTICGRVEAGPVPIVHLRSVIKMLQFTADQMGVPEDDDGVMNIKESIHPKSRAEHLAGIARFEELAKERREKGSGDEDEDDSAWG